MATAFMPESDSEDELPPGWEERATLEGQVYYANRDTQSTQWHHPRTKCRKRVPGKLPLGWKRDVMSDGRILYVNQETQKTTFSDPRLAFAVEDRPSQSINNASSIHSGNFRQRFDASTTADQILHGQDLTDKVAVITGGASLGGIGFEVARSMACHGCRVVLGARDLAKGQAAAQEIRKLRRHFNLRVDVLHLNLSSLQSVTDFADSFSDLMTSEGVKPRLDILVLNAAVMGLPRTTTENGLETMFQVNYLSQFLLAMKLLPIMRQTRRSILEEKPRVVFVSSESHRFTGSHDGIDSCGPGGNQEAEEDFVSMYAYNRSKLYALMFVLEAADRWRDVSCLAVHPGNMVSSGLGRNWWVYRILGALVRPFVKSRQQAAGTVVFAAAAPDMSGVSGVYINNCFPCQPHSKALEPESRRKLWNQSIQLINSKMPSANL